MPVNRVGRRWAASAAAAAALALGLACGKGETASSAPEAPTVLFETAVSGQLQPIADLACQFLEQHRAQLTDQQLAVAEEVVRREFGAEALRRRVLARLSEAAQGEQLEPVLQWLGSPIGERAAAAQAMASDPKALTEMKHFVEEKHEHPPSSERVALIERFNEAALTAETSSNTVLFATLGAAVMIDSIKPDAERLGPEKLRASSEARKPLVIPIFKEMSAIIYQLAFDNLSDEEIGAIVQFTESDAGRWYHQITSKALADALSETAMGVGDTYVAALDANPSS